MAFHFTLLHGLGHLIKGAGELTQLIALMTSPVRVLNSPAANPTLDSTKVRTGRRTSRLLPIQPSMKARQAAIPKPVHVFVPPVIRFRKENLLRDAAENGDHVIRNELAVHGGERMKTENSVRRPRLHHAVILGEDNFQK